jgi:hypothetical protein
MIWGIIGYNGPISLCKVTTRLNSQEYIDEILEKYVKTNKKII